MLEASSGSQSNAAEAAVGCTATKEHSKTQSPKHSQESGTTFSNPNQATSPQSELTFGRLCCAGRALVVHDGHKQLSQTLTKLPAPNLNSLFSCLGGARSALVVHDRHEEQGGRQAKHQLHVPLHLEPAADGLDSCSERFAVQKKGV